MKHYKLILYGDFGVGKTSLTTRLLRRNFNEQTNSTIGASFMFWKPDLVKNSPNAIGFGIWDTAGQERFSSLLPLYLRSADAVICCWDCTKPFNPVAADLMYNNAILHSPNCHFYLVVTKIDIGKDLDIVKSNTTSWAIDKNIEGVYFTSSLTGSGVQELFIAIAKKLLNTPLNQRSETVSIATAGTTTNRFGLRCCGV